MPYSSLSSLINYLETGTKMHICVAFLKNYGNKKTRCEESQTIHDRPVCLAVKESPQGLVSCYRCRNIVQKAVIRHRRSMSGLCHNGVYEYCRPVLYDDQVICVIFVGNLLTADPIQRKRLESRIDPKLLETMEQALTPKDCEAVADILESYILFLFEHYGIENKTFDPLIENIKQYIRENLTYGISISEMAAAFNYTPKYLGRIFKIRTGQSISQYCNAARVAKAKRLLSNTDMSVETIARQTGFNSMTYFDRTFHRITGLSPHNYRSSAKKPKRAK